MKTVLTCLTYGQALEAAKKGQLIARNGWNGKNMFVFMRPGDTLPAAVILNVKSLPIEVKHFLDQRATDVVFLPYLCMYAADGTVVNGWLASQTDMIAEDWCIVESAH